MSDMRMNSTRFRAIVEAYGAHAARWPEAERQAALDFVATSDAAQALLSEARWLDDMLDAVKAVDHARAEVDQPIFEAVLARFMPPEPASNVVRLHPAAPRRSGISRPVLWGTGIAIAACLAGAAFGVNLSLMGLTDVRAQTVLEQVAMIDGEN